MTRGGAAHGEPLGVRGSNDGTLTRGGASREEGAVTVSMLDPEWGCTATLPSCT